MSTILNTNGTELEVPQLLDAANFKCAVFTAEWNAEVTDALLKGVMDTFAKARVDPDNIFSQPVPGTVELVNAAGMAMRHHHPGLRGARRHAAFRLRMPGC